MLLSLFSQQQSFVIISAGVGVESNVQIFLQPTANSIRVFVWLRLWKAENNTVHKKDF